MMEGCCGAAVRRLLLRDCAGPNAAHDKTNTMIVTNRFNAVSVS